MKERFAAIFKTKTRDEWSAIFDGTDACVAPVLSPWEAHEHPHNVARSTFIEVDGAVQPAPAPRFSRTPSVVSSRRRPRAPTPCRGWSSGAWTRASWPSSASRGRSARSRTREEGPCGALLSLVRLSEVRGQRPRLMPATSVTPVPPRLPSNVADPKANTPPSDAMNQ